MCCGMTIFNLGAEFGGNTVRDHQYQQAVRGIEELQQSRKIFNVKVITSNTKKRILEAVVELEKLAVGEVGMLELLAVGELEMSEVLLQTDTLRKKNAAK